MKRIITLLFCFNAFSIFGQNALLQIDSILQKAYDNKALNGTVLIAKEGKTIFEKSYGYANFEKKTPLKRCLFRPICKQFGLYYRFYELI